MRKPENSRQENFPGQYFQSCLKPCGDMLRPPPPAELKQVTMASETPEGQIKQRAHPAVLPPYSSRTLHHPSFSSLYAAYGSMQCSLVARSHGQAGFPVPAMIPSDFFYTDPTQGPGSRMHNSITQLELFECCQLNTPPPIMSARIVPPITLDPFRKEPHPVRNLGCEVGAWDHLYGCQSSRLEVIQLSSEEDQAVTNLLKLHYSSTSDPDHHRFFHPACSPTGHVSTELEVADADSVCMPLTPAGPEQRSREWSDMELEAASILVALKDSRLQTGEVGGLVPEDNVN